MKLSWLTSFSIFCIAMITSSCATKVDNRPGVLKSYKGEIMFISSSGSKVGFSALELVEISEKYIDSRGLRKSLKGDKPTIWINTEGGTKLAEVSYDTKDNLKTLTIEINKNGVVTTHQIAEGVCGGSL